MAGVLPAVAHDWHRHDDPQFASAPFISPYAAGPKAGAIKLLASVQSYSTAAPDAGGSSSFAPVSLSAANLFAQTYLKFNPSVRFWWNSTNFFVESDGFPTHGTMEGIYSWQRQIPLPKYYFGTNIWALPLYPVPSGTNVLIDTNRFTQGAIALAANGIPIFNPYNNTGKISAQIGELDYWGGHCGRGDDYHYHAAPLHLTNTLDNVAGHTNNAGSYHYHASANYPYVNGGFHGAINEVISTNGQGQVVTQAGVQPNGQGPRPSGTPLNGARIHTFTNVGPDQYQMFFSVPSNAPPTNYWLYTLNRASNSVTVTYASFDGTGGVTTTNYANWKPAPAFTSTNEPLVTTQPTNLTLATGATATFSITAAGAGTPAYQWFKDGVELADGSGIGGANATALSITNVQPGDAGAYSVVVTNNIGNTMSASATLTVTGGTGNTPPTLTPVSNRTILPGDTLVITNVASDAETPGLLTFSLTNSPPGATISTNSGVLTWVTSNANAYTTNQFTVVVADNGSPNLTASQSFTVTVLGIGGTNTAPVFAAATNRYVINGGDTITITNIATDPQAPPQTLTYSLLTAPVSATINTNTGVVTWITTTNNSGTSNLFRVVVTDNGSPALSATNSFTVFVRSLKPNVVLIVTDDQGYHDISAHGAEAPTPNMDRIGSEGIRLERFYATPVCSVTRSTLLTGRNPVRTGVNNSHGLDLREHIMPVTFKAAGYQTFMCGKWHLGGLYNNTNTTVINGVTNAVIRENVDYQPQVRGWDTHYGEYTGAINYLAHTSQENGQLDWWLNGQTNLDAGWSTDLLAAKAVSLLQNRDPSKPVILYLAFNAVHPGVSAPTSYLNKYLSITNVTRRTMVAALDQMDVGIGSVLNTLDAEGIATNTLVVYFSDNGADTNGGGLNIPLRGTKTDLFDAGIHTPAAVRWPGVLPSGVTNCQQFVWAGDWFPTICAGTGVTPQNTKPFDGVNIWPLLLTATNGAFNPTSYRGTPLVSGSSAGSGIFDVFSNGTNLTMFKLIRDKLPGNTFSNYLFDIINDPSESNDVVNVPAYSNIVATLSAYYSNITTEAYSPYIGAHPQSQTVTVGANVTLWAMTTVYPKQLTTQWRKGGTNIVGQTNRTTLDTSVYLPRLDLTNVTAADSGNYDMVVTDNAVGWPTTVTSLVAVVTVNAAGSNNAPVLGVITNRTIAVGSTLLVTNVATDAESPPQVLTYTLPVAPTNAAINASSGVISWTPTSGQANTTNTFTTVVTDNGSPNLSATNSFFVTVPSNASPFLTISGVTNSPTAPTSNDFVWITTTIASSTTVTQAVLSYTTGAGGAATTNTVFSETMTPTAVTNGWDGTGADNLWTVVSLAGAGNIKQASNANHTPVGQGGQCGLEMSKGSSNATDTMVTTTSNFNATGASGYVEFWLGTVNVTNGLGWAFQLSTNGTTFITRTNETDGTVHGIQKYHYDLLPSELVSTLKIRFQFIGNNVGGPTGPKVRIDDIIVATATAGGAAYTNVAMADDGAHLDGAAGDGVYGAQIPTFSTGTMVNYFLTAANSGGLSATNPAGAPASNFSYTVTAAAPTIAYDVLLGRPTDTSIAVSLLASNDLAAYYEYGITSGSYTGQSATNSVTDGTPSVTTLSGLAANQKYYYRLRYSTNALAPFTAGTERTFRTQRARGSTFTFLIEADPHNRDNVPDVWKLALTNMLSDNADFLFDLGDTFFEEKVAATNAYYLTKPGIFDLHQEVRTGFFSIIGHSLPTFLVGGNHDPELGWLATGTNSSPVWGVQAREYFYPVPVPAANGFYSGATNNDPYTLAPRDGYYAFEWGDALFVGLDPFWYTTPKPQSDGWAWTLGTNQYNWLKRTLENSTVKFKFVFAHHLIGGGGGSEARGGLTYANNFEWGGYTTNGGYDFPTQRPGWPAPIKDLLLSNNVQAFFHGHDHLFVKEDYYAPGNTSAVPTFIYQEVPQPSQTTFSTNSAAGYGYTNSNSVVIASSGHLRVTISPTNALVEYLRVFRPVDEGAGKTNRMISYSYNIPAPVVGNAWSMLKLPDTGQVTDYTSTFGEDSDYTINAQSFTDNGNGTVTDNVTGLMWQKADGGEMTLSNALLFAQTNLNATNFAGYNDWRMPTVHELMSILNHDKLNPALDTNFFTSPGVGGATWGQVYWWSKDQKVGSTNQWCANAGGGVGPKPLSETISAGGSLNYRVRCVRGASAPTTPRSHFVNNGNGTITDTDTGLTWQQGEIGAATDWTNALNYAESLVLGGFQDWRLPNIKELESLNDETLASPSIDTNFFSGAKSARYWSSTTQFGHATNAWWNEFINGITSYEGTKTTNYWVRAVRGGLSNTAPFLTAISNRTLNAGVTLLITNSASDTQTAPGFLSFSLLTTLSNASLGASSGIFTWRPSVPQAGTTNLFAVVVADTGSPILTATQLFTITVNPLTNPPGVAALNSLGGQLQLQITGDAGPDYTVQASTNLASWTNLFTTNSPATPFFWLDPNAGSYTNRFYRVLLGP